MIPFATDPHFIDRPDITKWLTQKYRDSWSRLALIGMGGFGYEIALRLLKLLILNQHLGSPNLQFILRTIFEICHPKRTYFG